MARIVAHKGIKQVFAYGEDGALIAAYPATIGSTDTPSPSGTHTVERVALNPGYTYNPKINFRQGQNDKILQIPPGPNGPVGTVWIALSKPTYGIHGTPEPSKIGKTNSHGCIRLTNWDATELAKWSAPASWWNSRNRFDREDELQKPGGCHSAGLFVDGCYPRFSVRK